MQLLKFQRIILKFTRRPNLNWLHLDCASSVESSKAVEDIIISNTIVSTNHLTPELKLRLITPECDLWYAKCTESQFPNDPFWGIYWPGGEALARYILDNKMLFKGKRVIDIGSGCGACALAAAKRDAHFVLANDIDTYSTSAIHINARLNNLNIYTNSDDVIGEDIDSLVLKVSNDELCLKWDIVLIGDMFYDTEFSVKLFKWLLKLVKLGKLVLVGDPGRHALIDLNALKYLGTMVKIAEYGLVNKEHNGFSHGCVFRVSARAEDG